MSMHFDEKGKFFTEVITKQPVAATIQTETHLIEGNIHVRQRERVKDALDEADPFLAITDAIVYDHQGKTLYACQFMAVSSTHVVWVIPDEDIQPADEGMKEQT